MTKTGGRTVEGASEWTNKKNMNEEERTNQRQREEEEEGRFQKPLCLPSACPKRPTSMRIYVYIYLYINI